MSNISAMFGAEVDSSQDLLANVRMLQQAMAQLAQAMQGNDWRALNMAMQAGGIVSRKNFHPFNQDPQIKSNVFQLMDMLRDAKKRRDDIVKAEGEAAAAARQQEAQTPMEMPPKFQGPFGRVWDMTKIQKAIGKGKATSEEMDALMAGNLSEAQAKDLHKRIHGGGLMPIIGLVGVGAAAYFTFKG